MQVVLLAAIVLLPGRDDWPVGGAVRALGVALVLGGVVLGLVASLRLGSSLTPTPVPRSSGRLEVTGPYRYVRHPIYTAVLMVVVGVAIGSGSWITATVAVVTISFFHHKAAWEETQLAKRYEDYPAYAARTPRFLPRPWSGGAT